MNKNGTIGLDGTMPWHVPGDLQFFKRYTMNKTVVMGRKTYDGLPKTLKGRTVLKVSRLAAEDAIEDFAQYLEMHQHSDEEIVIAGGGEIYRWALPYATRLVLSYIHNNETIGDVTFPDFSINDFKIISRTEYVDFTQITYERRKV